MRNILSIEPDYRIKWSKTERLDQTESKIVSRSSSLHAKLLFFKRMLSPLLSAVPPLLCTRPGLYLSSFPCQLLRYAFQLCTSPAVPLCTFIPPSVFKLKCDSHDQSRPKCVILLVYCPHSCFRLNITMKCEIWKKILTLGHENTKTLKLQHFGGNLRYVTVKRAAGTDCSNCNNSSDLVVYFH